MEDAEMEVYRQELEKGRILNEHLGLGIGLFQVQLLMNLSLSEEIKKI
jgi:hypothetical protein